MYLTCKSWSLSKLFDLSKNISYKLFFTLCFTNVLHRKKLSWHETFFLENNRKMCCSVTTITKVFANSKSVFLSSFSVAFVTDSLRRWFTLCLGGEGGELREERKSWKRGVFALGHIYYLTGIWESLCVCNTLPFVRCTLKIEKKSLSVSNIRLRKFFQGITPLHHMLQIKQVSTLCKGVFGEEFAFYPFQFFWHVQGKTKNLPYFQVHIYSIVWIK